MNYPVLIVLAAVCLCLTATTPSKTSAKRVESPRIQRQSSKFLQRVVHDKNGRQPESRQIDQRKGYGYKKPTTKPNKVSKTIDYKNCPTDIGPNTVCGVVLPLFHCYCYVFDEKIWTDARDFCVANGMSLLRVETLREFTQLQATILPTDEWWTDVYISTTDLDALGSLTIPYYDFVANNVCPNLQLPDFPYIPCNSTASRTGAEGNNSEIDPGSVSPCSRSSDLVMFGITFQKNCFNSYTADTLLPFICQN